MSFAVLNIPFLLVAGTVLLVALGLGRRDVRRVVAVLLLSAVVLFLLTAVFDSLMIYVGLFDYGSQSLAGPRIGLAPVEDFAYPLAALLLLPGLWWLICGRGSNGDQG